MTVSSFSRRSAALQIGLPSLPSRATCLQGANFEDFGDLQSSLRPLATELAASLTARERDGRLRGSVDYSGLVTLTVRETIPVPKSDGMLDRFGTACYLLRFDRENASNFIHIRPEDVAKMAFENRYGSLYYLVMPLGI